MHYCLLKARNNFFCNICSILWLHRNIAYTFINTTQNLYVCLSKRKKCKCDLDGELKDTDRGSIQLDPGAVGVEAHVLDPGLEVEAGTGGSGEAEAELVSLGKEVETLSLCDL